MTGGNGKSGKPPRLPASVDTRSWSPGPLVQGGGGVNRGAYGSGEQAIAMMASIAVEPHMTNGPETSAVKVKVKMESGAEAP